MQLWILTGLIALLVLGIWMAVPIFAIIVGSGVGILVLHEFIKIMEEEDEKRNKDP